VRKNLDITAAEPILIKNQKKYIIKSMKVIRRPQKIQDIVKKLRLKKFSIGLVPTMGALHPAHLSLIDRARKENDIVIVSIFVNPKQFGPNEDYLRYPRPFKKDISLCKKHKVDYVFAPKVNEMYPEGYLTYVNVEKISDILCGKFRPGHFRGVATVVTKLFNITLPHRAYFGEKDYQQLKIIQKMVKDLNFPVEIVPCKTVREPDGLAMSSRNLYLNDVERRNANKIYLALKEISELISSKKIKNVVLAKEFFRKKIEEIPGARIDYIEICEPETLDILRGNIILPARILTAVWIGNTRLIDNIEVKTG